MRLDETNTLIIHRNIHGSDSSTDGVHQALAWSSWAWLRGVVCGLRVWHSPVMHEKDPLVSNYSTCIELTLPSFLLGSTASSDHDVLSNSMYLYLI